MPVSPLPRPIEPTSETVPAEPDRRDYFPELDGLRFLAFALVYLFHMGIPQFTGWVRAALGWLPEGSWISQALPADLGERLRANGWAGVQLFFVLSGFLITTLLLREEARYGRIDLKAFWMRRILRIWPLYYLTVFLGFLVLPWLQGDVGSTSYHQFLAKHLAGFLVFCGNWSMGLRGPVPYDWVSILWSVCVEEQFYIAGPLLLTLVPSRARIALVISLMGLSVASRWWMATRGAGVLLFQYSSLTHLDTLLAGVLVALVLFRYPPGRLLVRLSGWLQVPIVLACLWLLIRPELAHGEAASKTWGFVWIWIAFAALVASLVVGRGWLSRALAYDRLVWLGRISYGLYMFHEIALWLARRTFDALGWFPNKEILHTIFAFALTVGIAAASYYLYERPFLRLKRIWTRVPSRPI